MLKTKTLFLEHALADLFLYAFTCRLRRQNILVVESYHAKPIGRFTTGVRFPESDAQPRFFEMDTKRLPVEKPAAMGRNIAGIRGKHAGPGRHGG